MTDVDEMAAFVEARVAEDDAAARAASQGEWIALDGGVQAIADDDQIQWPVADTQSERNREDRVHIARHQPARVLLEIEAKRAILRDYHTTVRIRDEAAERINAAGSHPDPADLDEWTRASREAAVLAGVVQQLASAWERP